jgi:hypothetical protein
LGKVGALVFLVFCLEFYLASDDAYGASLFRVPPDAAVCKEERKKEKTSRDLEHLDSPADLKMPVYAGTIQYMKIFIRFVLCSPAKSNLSPTPTQAATAMVF